MKISNRVRELLKHTIKEEVITKLVEVIEMTTDPNICSKALKSLKEIPLNNDVEINSLLELFQKTENPTIRSGIVKCLAKIEVRNEKVITALNTMLATTIETENRWVLAHSLAQIDPGNEIAIKELIWNSYTWKNSIFTTSLSQVTDANKRSIIDPGNEMAIRELTTLLETTTEPNVIRKVAECLGQIDPGNLIAIRRLTNLLETTTAASYNCLDIAESLGKIDPGNELAINALTNLLKLPETHKDSLSIWAADSLDKIDPGNKLAAQLLIEVFSLLKFPKDEGVPRDFDYVLKKMQNHEDFFDPIDIIYKCNNAYGVLRRMSITNKLLVIEALIGILETYKNDEIVSTTIAGYLDVAYGNQLAIQALIRILKTTTGVFNRVILAGILEKIDPGNKLAITALTALLETTKNKEFRFMINVLFWEINPSNKKAINQLIWEYEKMSILKNKEDIKSFSDFSEMIWKATQIVSYPRFYQLWFYNNNLVAIYGIYRIIYARIHKFANVVIVPLKKWLKK